MAGSAANPRSDIGSSVTIRARRGSECVTVDQCRRRMLVVLGAVVRSTCTRYDVRRARYAATWVRFAQFPRSQNLLNRLRDRSTKRALQSSAAQRPIRETSSSITASARAIAMSAAVRTSIPALRSARRGGASPTRHGAPAAAGYSSPGRVRSPDRRRGRRWRCRRPRPRRSPILVASSISAVPVASAAQAPAAKAARRRLRRECNPGDVNRR